MPLILLLANIYEKNTECGSAFVTCFLAGTPVVVADGTLEESGGPSEWNASNSRWGAILIFVASSAMVVRAIKRKASKEDDKAIYNMSANPRNLTTRRSIRSQCEANLTSRSMTYEVSQDPPTTSRNSKLEAVSLESSPSANKPELLCAAPQLSRNKHRALYAVRIMRNLFGTAGARVALPLDVSEMGLPPEIRGIVVANEPSPTIDNGPGRLVTTTISHLNKRVMRLDVRSEELQESIFVTAYHKFFSVDRCAFISAEELKIGERLSGLTGGVTVVACTPIPGIHRVSNILRVEDFSMTTTDDCRIYLPLLCLKLADPLVADFLRRYETRRAISLEEEVGSIYCDKKGIEIVVGFYEGEAHVGHIRFLSPQYALKRMIAWYDEPLVGDLRFPCDQHSIRQHLGPPLREVRNRNFDEYPLDDGLIRFCYPKEESEVVFASLHSKVSPAEWTLNALTPDQRVSQLEGTAHAVWEARLKALEDSFGTAQQVWITRRRTRRHDIDILAFQANDGYRLMTLGMSDQPFHDRNVPNNFEIEMLVPQITHEALIRLSLDARFPWDNNCIIGHGHSIAWYWSVEEKSPLRHDLFVDCGTRINLLSLDASQTRTISVLRCVQITDDDLEFKRRNGVEKLLESVWGNQ